MTIREVAALAGVSIGTASKALNGQGKLRTETRERVAQAARELGFAPNVLARGLLAGRTYSVGLITTDSFGRFSIPVMLGAEDALGAGQMSVFMCDTRDDPVPGLRAELSLAVQRLGRGPDRDPGERGNLPDRHPPRRSLRRPATAIAAPGVSHGRPLRPISPTHLAPPIDRILQLRHRTGACIPGLVGGAGWPGPVARAGFPGDGKRLLHPVPVPALAAL